MQLGKHFSTVIAACVGLGLVVVLLRSIDVATLRATVSRVGLAAPVVVAIQLCVVAIAGLGWAPLVVAPRRPHLFVLVGLRFVRESVNVLLPVASMGGDVVGGRLLTRWSVPPEGAAASIVVDLTAQFFTQLLFAAMGIAVLAASGKNRAVVLWASLALGIGLLGWAGAFAIQHLGSLRFAKAGLGWAARRWPAASLVVRLHDNLQVIYARPGKVALSVGLHLAAWLLGALESFAVLAAVGADPSLAMALVVESLGQAIKSSASPVPGAIGVQEGGYVLLVGLYGLPPETGLALSLTKRIPDLLIGMAGLTAWLGLELGHIGPPKVRRAAAIAEGVNDAAL
jgi:putative membrane protein